MTMTINGSGTITGLTAGGLPDGVVTPEDVSAFNVLGNYANDAAAAVGGVAIGAMYRNGSVIMVRVA
jgi:hypothetical protein